MRKTVEAKDFERLVVKLLSTSGRDVQPETQVGHKKVDAVLTEVRYGTRYTIAVECKAYKRPLTIEQVSAIYADYVSLIQAGLVHEILLITAAGLSAGARAKIREHLDLHHQTLRELQDSVMEFDGYLHSLVGEYEADGLDHYYVEQFEETTGRSMDDEIPRWMKSPTSVPLAILGSYGIGKSTLARSTCYKQAIALREDPTLRIPILISLNGISTEQSLEGLLGKLLTSDHPVRGYSFGLFMELNRLGRFVIFLDGFDEMKHTMSWEDFRYNFQQLNRLVVKDSKVVLLGRPTAFLSEDERREALHGIRWVGEREVRDVNWPDYSEHRLALFMPKQIETFLTLYLNYQKSLLPEIDPSEKSASTKRRSKESRVRRSTRKIEALVEAAPTAIARGQLLDVARRPVQLRMLVDVLPEWDRDLSDLTTALLYSVFIDIIIQREIDKKRVRRSFDKAARHRFARQVAWWMWTERHHQIAVASEIPDRLFVSYVTRRRSLETVRRDLVSACFLDTTNRGELFFPHRSFQEFLVAEHIHKGITKQLLSFDDAQRYTTPEISQFMADLVEGSSVRPWLVALSNHRGLIEDPLIGVLLGSSDAGPVLMSSLDEALHAEAPNPWLPMLATLASIDGRLEFITADSLLGKLQRQLLNTAEEKYSLICYLCICALVSMTPGLMAEKSRKRSVLLGRALASLCEKGEWQQKGKKQGKKKERVFKPYADVKDMLRRITFTDRKGAGQASARWADLRGSYGVILRCLRGHCIPRRWILGGTLALERRVPFPSAVKCATLEGFAEVELYKERYQAR